VGIYRRFFKIAAFLVAAISLGGCVVRPLGWGDRGGHGRYESRQYESDRGQSREHETRDEPRRRNP
jgi:hypothetical protein